MEGVDSEDGASHKEAPQASFTQEHKMGNVMNMHEMRT